MTASCGCVREAPPNSLACDQAVSARRPLRRRLETTARPARVRIRKRKPCTRARRRLFGWKVRLPLATTFSSHSNHLAAHVCRLHSSASRPGVGLATGRRGPRAESGSQPYRRLSGDCLRVLTRLRWVKLGLPQRPQLTDPRKQKFSMAALRHHRTTGDMHVPQNPREADWNGTERLAAAPKTVSFGQCRFSVGRRQTTKRGWRID